MHQTKSFFTEMQLKKSKRYHIYSASEHISLIRAMKSKRRIAEKSQNPLPEQVPVSPPAEDDTVCLGMTRDCCGVSSLVR
jgi:hypothetical protein